MELFSIRIQRTFQLVSTAHDVIGAQPHGVGRLLAVAFLRLLLPFLPLAFPLDYRHKCDVHVRCFLVQVQVSRHDVLLPERVGKIFEVVGAPLVQPSRPFDAFHVFGRCRHVDADCPHLVAPDFACQSSFFQPPLDSRRTVFHSFGIFDEFSV